MDGSQTNDPGDPAEPGRLVAPAEESLLRDARAGDQAAIERLYADHLASARRLATILVGAEAADELVSESFARVITQLRAGGGPTASFRAYLNTSIRNLHRDQLRRAREVPVSDRPWLLEQTESPVDEFIERLDANGATAALSSLPGTWQQVLWHSEVEGRKPAEIAQLLATSPAAVSSLVYRAREGLRRAYLDQYAGPTPIDDRCRWARARLSQHVRDDLSGRAAAKLSNHLATCSACSAAHSEMAQLNTKLAAYLFPVVLIGGLNALDGATGAPSALVTELAARAEGTPVGEASAAANSGSSGTGRPSTRTTVTVAAMVVALVAMGATAVALSSGDGEPRSAPGDAVTTEADDDTTPQVLPTPTTPVTEPPVTDPSTPSATPGAPASTTPGVTDPTTSVQTDPAVPRPPTGQPTRPPPTVAEPEPTAVRPVAPTATSISKCGSYGSLRLPRTLGVRYALVAGDGREGPWAVGATAVPGYVIAKGVPTRFSGDLGRFEPCPVQLAIREVATRQTGDQANDPWEITVTPTKPDQERRALSVTYWFDTEVVVLRRQGDGWTCRGPGGAEIGNGSAHTFEPRARLKCTYAERGERPPPVSLTVRAVSASGSLVAPSGSVSLLADNDVIDIEDFDSVDR